MKRAIKFRGKRSDNGEWVYGDLVENQGRFFIYHATSESTIENNDDGRIVVVAVEVDSSTVGQYTGLKDKDGNEIYEGDIIKQIGYSGNVKAIVQFDKGCFMCGWHHGSSTQRTPRLIQSRCEVLGNIHDNPELLKGGERTNKL